MPNLPEGFRRVSMLAGLVGVTAWTVFVALGTRGFRGMHAADWWSAVPGALLAFGAPWALVRGVGWAVEGFRARER